MYFGFRGITAAYGKRRVLEDLTLEVRRGEFLTIIGPNGCGKSSLMKTVSRVLRPALGEVILCDRPMASYSRREFARRVACLAQTHTAPPDMDVRTLVSCGRYPYRRFGHALSTEDTAVIENTMALAGLNAYADRPLCTLSGGERQKAWIAMSVCRRPEILLLDEPTTYLDVRAQMEILDMICRFQKEMGMTVVTVLHDLNLAARYSDRLAVLNDKHIRAIGTPEEILTESNLREVFGICAEIRRDSPDGHPYCIPISSV